MIEIDRDLVGIGDDAVAHAEGALGRFDQAVDVLETLRLRDAQAIEQRQDHQRGQPLRRRRRIVKRAGLDAHAERLRDDGFEFFQIGARHRAADALQIGGDLAADVAAIEIVEPGLAEMLERVGECALLEPRAGLRRLAVDQEGLQKARRGFQLGIFLDRQPRLAARHRVALARVLDGRRQQQVERQPAAVRFGGLTRASIQAATAPGTVSAASGPRAGISS